MIRSHAEHRSWVHPWCRPVLIGHMSAANHGLASLPVTMARRRTGPPGRHHLAGVHGRGRPPGARRDRRDGSVPADRPCRCTHRHSLITARSRNSAPPHIPALRPPKVSHDSRLVTALGRGGSLAANKSQGRAPRTAKSVGANAPTGSHVMPEASLNTSANSSALRPLLAGRCVMQRHAPTSPKTGYSGIPAVIDAWSQSILNQAPTTRG